MQLDRILGSRGNDPCIKVNEIILNTVRSGPCPPEGAIDSDGQVCTVSLFLGALWCTIPEGVVEEGQLVYALMCSFDPSCRGPEGRGFVDGPVAVLAGDMFRRLSALPLHRDSRGRYLTNRHNAAAAFGSLNPEQQVRFFWNTTNGRFWPRLGPQIRSVDDFYRFIETLP